MAAYNGRVLGLDFPMLSPRLVTSIPLSSTIRTNVTPLATNFINATRNYQVADYDLGVFNWTNTQIAITSNAWPTRKPTGDFNSHTGPIGFDGPGFDWFEKFIVEPTRIDLGAFASKTEQVTVYSSFRYVLQQLDGINLTTGGDTQITNPPTFPYQHPTQHQLSVTFQAGPAGPAIIDGSITFDYVTRDSVIPVTGQRVFIFPWVPEEKVKETLEWSTDIIKATNKEYRRSLRAAARITRNFTFYLSETQRIEFEKDAANRQVLYTAPSWWDARYISGVSVNDTVINVDTSFSEFYENGLCLLVEPESNTFEVKNIDSLTASTITLDTAVVNAYNTGFIVPVLAGILATSTLKVHNQDHYFATVEIIATQAFERTPPSYTQLLGIDLLEDRTVVKKSIPVNITRAGKVVDNKIGPVQFFSMENRGRVQERFEWSTNGYQQLSELKDWLYSRFGRQKQFLYPTWQSDLLIHTDDYLGGSGALNVKTTELEAPFYIQVELNDGTTYQAQVTSISKDAGFDTLTLNPAIPSGFTVGEVKYISKVRLMRQSSDSIQLTYTNHLVTAAAVNVVEV